MSNFDEKLFVNFEKKVGGFQKLIRPDVPKSVMVIEAAKDMGKSWLVSWMQQYCQRDAGVPVATIHFGDALEIYRIEDDLDLVRLLRDRLGQPQYFNQLNAIINQYTDPDLSGNTSALAILRRNIEEYFNLEELQDLTFEIGIRYENIAGDTLRAKTRELVIYCDRNSLIELLLTTLERERPSVPIKWREGFNTTPTTLAVVTITTDTPIEDKRGRIQALSDREREYAEQQINQAFFDCLTKLATDKAPLVFLLDATEKAPTKATRWIQHELLQRIRQGLLPQANVIMTGRKTFDLTDLEIRHLLVETSLTPFGDDHIREYIFDRRGITGYELSFFVDASGGIPGLLAIMADNVARKYQDDDDDFFSDL
ncbi:MAG: hypothetical protein H6658_16270 [Ardenticatenaceae bacterium]|nr:hypothetical protein [Ardenticatenaceae bacterium]